MNQAMVKATAVLLVVALVLSFVLVASHGHIGPVQVVIFLITAAVIGWVLTRGSAPKA